MKNRVRCLGFLKIYSLTATTNLKTQNMKTIEKPHQFFGAPALLLLMEVKLY